MRRVCGAAAVAEYKNFAALPHDGAYFFNKVTDAADRNGIVRGLLRKEIFGNPLIHRLSVALGQLLSGQFSGIRLL